MKIISNLTNFQKIRGAWRKKIAFVPTMGNLHAGHLALIQEALTHADKVVVSIFVNPLQFAPHEDFHSYPRTLVLDLEKLAPLGVDVVFVPKEEELYPQGKDKQTQVYVPELGTLLCGQFRPHFFQGVTTVVCKLFHIIKPHVAIFGEKDFQQLYIIRRMVADLHLDIEIIASPIVRENSGLALSSRNQYLTPQEKKIAPFLFAELQKTAQVLSGCQMEKFTGVLQQAKQNLTHMGFKVDYFEIRTASLTIPNSNDTNLRIFAAAWLGKTRLIDNFAILIC